MRTAIKNIRTPNLPVDAAPLAAFRVLFGVLMAASLVRFAAMGWIEKLYLEPEFHFTYLGLEWVRPLGLWTYAIFAAAFLGSIGLALGFYYRLSTATFLLAFTYIEAMDKTTYLNHYYFISIVALLLLLLPAHHAFSADARAGRTRSAQIPLWSLRAVQILVGTVYFYAGLAKLNSDWLLHAQPLALWLPGRTDLPLLGPFMETRWVHFAFSWAGALFDLSIPFLLLMRRTRPYAYVVVILFHVLTRLLFPIGMFPFIMVAAATIFFSASWHRRWLIFAFPSSWHGRMHHPPRPQRALRLLATALLAAQLLLPWRYLLYPGELFWHEQGFRFSWRVMLMEKQGYTTFTVHDPATGERWQVNNADFLTPFQEKQMAFQPDFILEYAHYLEDVYQTRDGRGDLAVYAQSYVALNGRPSQPFVQPDADLTQYERNLKPITWLMPFPDDIKGL